MSNLINKKMTLIVALLILITLFMIPISTAFAELINDDTILLINSLKLKKENNTLFEGSRGVLVLEITQGSQAVKIGLQRGDITAVP